MPIEKFGRYSSSRRINENVQNRKPIGYVLTPEGDFNMESRQVKNIGEPSDDNDAVSKKTLDISMDRYLKLIREAIEQSMRYMETQHNQILETLMHRQNTIRNEILDLIIKQEGKLRDLINVRSDTIEKNYNALKLDLTKERSTIERQLFNLDQHIKKAHGIDTPAPQPETLPARDTTPTTNNKRGQTFELPLNPNKQEHKVMKKGFDASSARNVETNEESDPDHW